LISPIVSALTSTSSRRAWRCTSTADQWRPFLKKIDELVAEAPDEPARRYTLRVALEAAFETVTGTRLEFETPRKVVRLLSAPGTLHLDANGRVSPGRMSRAEGGACAERSASRRRRCAALTEAMREMAGQIADLKGCASGLP
jgi:hypothetical protein